MNSFHLKILACITMFLDHFARLFQPVLYPLIYIGRLAFPIFAFQASIGFSHTKNIKKYIFRLFLFAIISQIPFALYINNNSLNVIFTILFGIISIYLYEKLVKRNLYPLAFLIVAFIGFLAQFLETDYGCYGVFIIFLFHLTKNNKILTTLSFFILTTMFYVNELIIYGFSNITILKLIFALSAIIPILLYNNKQGKKVKYIIYIFYPLHLFILYLAKTLFF